MFKLWRALIVSLSLALPALPATAQSIIEDRVYETSPVDEEQELRRLRDADQLQKQMRWRIAFNEAAPETEAPADRAWLGVQLCPIPAALVEHLQLGNQGVMVCNVFRNSPADKAGLDRYDIILRADDKDTAGGPEAVGQFSESIRHKKPGDSIHLDIVHRGKKTSLDIKLASLPNDLDQWEPKYKDDPDIAFSKELGLRGKIFRPGAGGWIMEDLGEFPGFRERLERDLRGMRGGAGGGMAGPPGSYEFKQRKDVREARRVDKNGEVLQVQRDADGKITVRRYRKDREQEKSKVAVFDNMDELRKADPQAFDLLESAKPPTPPEPLRDRLLPGIPRAPATPKAPAGPDARRDQPEPAPGWREWERGFYKAPLHNPMAEALAPAPRTTFQVAPDGQITVNVRDGDAQMSKTYRSADELREQAPRLFKRYQEMESRLKE